MTKRKKQPRPHELYAAQIGVWLRSASGVVPCREVQDSKLHRYELATSLYSLYESWCDEKSQPWKEGKPGALPVFPASPVAFYRALDQAGLDRHVLGGNTVFLCAKLPYRNAPNQFRRRVVTSAMLADMEREAENSTGAGGCDPERGNAGAGAPSAGDKI